MFKKILSIAFAALAIGACSYDDSELRALLAEQEQRIAALEALCKQMNSDIASLKTLLDADFIQNCREIVEGGIIVGYSITLAKGGVINIYNGVDGHDGTDGHSPAVSVRKDADGHYYWTIDGEWLYADGHRLRADGSDGNTPLIRIEDGFWAISYDGGASWTRLGPTAESEASAPIFSSVDTSSPTHVVFHLAGGASFSVPLMQIFRIGEDEGNGAYAFSGTVTLPLVMPAGLDEASFSSLRACICLDDGTVQDVCTKAGTVSEWKLTLTPPSFSGGKYAGGAAVSVEYTGSERGLTVILEAYLVWTDGTVTSTMRPLQVR